MKAKVIRSFIDKYTMQDIDKGAEIEITEARFSELTTGPRGVFVEEIKEDSTEETQTNQDEQKEQTTNSEEDIKEEKVADQKKTKSTKK